ncbi:helix-turn-helix domain-containing protein [Mesorhizobium xinjiangense]|uniref:helix-turn-helix domain-containing protein n=1 Tax=Mesorhizobium xinjiangense TaxID=2678685 RepID=UPI0018DBD3F8|nr:AraC family transcriptional regulator [Mesorhizobium xinjiangense]
MDVVERDTRKDFRAELLHYAAPDGSTFGMASGDDVVVRFAKPDREFVLFSLPLSGSAELTQGSDAARVVSPDNGFLALDSTRPLTTATKRYKHLYLTIPRAKVIGVLNDSADMLRDGLLSLPSSGVAELLKSHLLMTAKEGQRLNAHGVAAAVRCGVDLALETLAQELVRNGHSLRQGPTEALYAATCRYIQLHLGDSTLTTARVAHAVGCSRAHLNRAFAERDERVGETIRLARLQAACTLLASSANPSIEQIAHSCGFASASAFARAFRDFAGMPPSAYRELRAPEADSYR